MQYVNDDMDELFRRAAENYPLDTNSADWNKVLAAMQGQDASKVDTKKNKNNSRFLWLLLLLPLGLICNRLYSPGVSVTSSSQSFAQKENSVSKERTVQKNQSANNVNADVIRTAAAPSKASEANISSVTSSSEKNYQENSQQSELLAAKNKLPVNHWTSFSNGTTQVNTDINSNDEFFQRNYVREIILERDEPGSPEFSLIQESILQNPSDEKQQQKPQTGKRQKKLYIGLIGGIDATTVKFQKIENKGHDFGVLVGYQLSKKWNIETGSYVENKYYYSEGKYFKAPASYRVKDVSGDCKMIEVPLSVRYNFSLRKNSSWFATLGSSSFLMTREGYTYNYANPIWPSAYIERRNSSFNLFTNISLTGGYTHKLGRLTDFRIEPYLKIPVSGMGIGKLPLLSTGLHVGVIKKF